MTRLLTSSELHLWRSCMQNGFRPCRKWYTVGGERIEPSITKTCSYIRTYSGQSFQYTSKKINLVTPLYLQAEKYMDRIAVVDQHGIYSYSDILHFTNALCDKIVSIFNCGTKDDIKGERIAFLCPNDMSYIVTQWAGWMSGGIIVPLSPHYPPSELEYFITDSQSQLVITTEEFSDHVQPAIQTLGVKHLVLKPGDYLPGVTDTADLDTAETDLQVRDSQASETQRLARLNRLTQLCQHNKFKYKNALIIYTSGTTGKPKGVVYTYGSLQAQMDAMITAWGWTCNDVVLHVLPLHHVHGVVNVLMTSLFSGAVCVMLPKFDAKKVWSVLLSPVSNSLPRSVNLFMAVPTIYTKMIEDYDQRLNRGRGTKQAKSYIKARCSSKIRLMVSGSAALPHSVMERWEEISGHRLLERYGMTETGMVLTNPLRGQRIPGAVGLPFPKVEVCITQPNAYSNNGYDIIAQGDSRRTRVNTGSEGEEGELFVKGPNVFKEYWNKPEATKETFTKDGWFKTGDTASYENGVYHIRGRTSVDIIKSGGYKISALDIERHLLTHPDITDVAVLGLPDVTWGQKVAAVVVFRQNSPVISLSELRNWAKDKMASYQLPSTLKVLENMPRNAMGKVNKKDLLKTVFYKEIKQSAR